MSQEQQIDRKDLKIQALLEKVSNMTAQYENQVADLRVELTIATQELDQYHQQEAATNATVEDADVQEKPAKSRN